MDRDPQKDLELCSAATPGPWEAYPYGYPISEDGMCVVPINAEVHPYADVVCKVGVLSKPRNRDQVVADAMLIASARGALPYWIRRAEGFREKYNAASMELEGLREQSRWKLARELAEKLGRDDPAAAERGWRRAKQLLLNKCEGCPWSAPGCWCNVSSAMKVLLMGEEEE